MLYGKSNNLHLHREGHVMGKRPKRQSQGDAHRKRGSFKGKKAYRGQGR